MPTTTTGITYDREGELGRRTVLLLHADIADRRMWDPQWPALVADHDVVRPDLRGYGDSDTPPDGPVDHVADVLALLDELDVVSCDVVAASYGSGVAVEAALAAPERVRSLVLAPPGGSLLATMTADLRGFLDAEGAALADGDLEAAVAANVEAWVVGRGRSLADVEPDVAERVRRMQRRAFEVAAALGDVDEVEADPPALARLGDVRAPTLVLVGHHDLETTLDAADRVVDGLADVRRVDWADVAHLPSLEAPGRFTELVVDWLATHPA